MIDNVEISVRPGNGGPGIVSFYREKYHPLGGPDGGDGGSGGNVYIVADKGVIDLSCMMQSKIFQAEHGKPGGKQKKHGKNGEDLTIRVPLGTAVSEIQGDETVFIADLMRDGQKLLAAHGGKGGWGNVHYTSATNRAPRKASPGAMGEEVHLFLEYRSPIDVGIIGLPNSGKSTLLAEMTYSRPKVADYPFTTQEIMWGHTEVDKQIITVAEIPALIQGACQGKGLGNQFLRHCLRAKALLLLLDITSTDIYRDLATLREELRCYSKDLAHKIQIVVVNKVDLGNSQQHLREIRQTLEVKESNLFFISARTGEGIKELLEAVGRLMATSEFPELFVGQVEKVFRPKPIQRRKLS